MSLKMLRYEFSDLVPCDDGTSTCFSQFIGMYPEEIMQIVS